MWADPCVRLPFLVCYSAIFAELCWQMEVLLSRVSMGRYLESKQSRIGWCFQFEALLCLFCSSYGPFTTAVAFLPQSFHGTRSIPAHPRSDTLSFLSPPFFSESDCLRRILIGERGSPLPLLTDASTPPLNDYYFTWQTPSYLTHAHGPHTQTKRS